MFIDKWALIVLGIVALPIVVPLFLTGLGMIGQLLKGAGMIVLTIAGAFAATLPFVAIGIVAQLHEASVAAGHTFLAWLLIVVAFGFGLAAVYWVFKDDLTKLMRPKTG